MVPNYFREDARIYNRVWDEFKIFLVKFRALRKTFVSIFYAYLMFFKAHTYTLYYTHIMYIANFENYRDLNNKREIRVYL